MTRSNFILSTSMATLALLNTTRISAYQKFSGHPANTKRGFLKLEMEASNLQELFQFYRDRLGFDCSRDNESLKVNTGSTCILFKKSQYERPTYHIAWAIPGNRLQESKKWLKSRTVLLHDSEGKDAFYFTNINRTGIYFKDPAGNILEFICLHDLPAYNNQDSFSIKDILFVNHVGIAVKDVFKEITQIQDQLSLGYLGQLTKDFSKIGNDYHHVTLVSENRLWIPERKEPAKIYPIKMTIPSNRTCEYKFQDYPYIISCKIM